ncbi:MAG: hypothetical protein ABL921_09110 [Pirellula sp.]
MTESLSLETLKSQWQAAWPQAIADWSPYIQLHEPAWCLNVEDEKRESLSGSFAMIRLVDHTVVISLKQILEEGLEGFSAEVLAHEIGHHVYCPADLTDNARLLARMRRGLPGLESYAPMIVNLYADLLINDYLQRSCRRDMAGVYLAIQKKSTQSKLWLLYLRTYELLWSLPRKALTSLDVDARINQDALLSSRLIRSYSKDWLAGGGRFACLYLPYVSEEAETARKEARIWCDTIEAGNNGCPDGLTEIDEDELTGAIHPAEDSSLSGLDPIDLGDPSELSELEGQARGQVSSENSGRKSIKSYRDPFEYAEILRASGVNLNEREIAVRYYRERAIPYLIPFPVRENPSATDPIPEGLDLWDPSSEIDRIDWMSSLAASPVVIPGVTTRERLVGSSPGSEPQRTPFDLYLGVDCSGSMRDPALTLSYPVLAGAVIALSALRVGAKVKVLLSGEPGQSVSTDGFVRDQSTVLRTLVNYLGTGYSFGIHRLSETFQEKVKLPNPVHVLVLSDYDMFTMLQAQGGERLGWDVAREAVQLCGGGATYVLQLPGYEGTIRGQHSDNLDRMKQDGWNVHIVNSMEELLVFARQFSRVQYQQR